MTDLRIALFGGAIATVVILVVIVVTGTASGVEGVRLLENAAPTIRFLASGSVTASAAILALLLTLLGLTFGTEHRFPAVHYDRVSQIAALSAISMVAAVAILLVVTIPITEADRFVGWATTVYYMLAVGAALLGGLLITIVLMLYRTIRGLISLGHPSREPAPLVRGPEEG